MNYGQQIRDQRDKLGIKQGDLAARVGMAQDWLSSREVGRVEMTQVEAMGCSAAIEQIMVERKAAYEELQAI